MEIRPLGEEDAEIWFQLRRQGLAGDPHAFGQSVAEHESRNIEWYATRLRETPPPSFTLGAFDDRVLAGIATFIRETQEKHRHKGHIYGFYVSPAHRGKGLGARLMSALLGRATQDPLLEQILLAVTSQQNAAQALYRKFGFEIWGTEPRALRIGSVYVDQHHMILRQPS